MWLWLVLSDSGPASRMLKLIRVDVRDVSLTHTVQQRRLKVIKPKKKNPRLFQVGKALLCVLFTNESLKARRFQGMGCQLVAPPHRLVALHLVAGARATV